MVDKTMFFLYNVYILYWVHLGAIFNSAWRGNQMKAFVFKIAFYVVAFELFVKEFLGKAIELFGEKVPGAYLPLRLVTSGMRLPGFVAFGLSVDGQPPKTKAQIESEEQR